jgi:hypothetical protein
MNIIINTMPQKYKEAWVTALRSGKYKQSIGILKCEFGYCCLGVLQEAIAGDVEYFPHQDANKRALTFPSFSWLEQYEITWKMDNCLSQSPYFKWWKDEYYTANILNDLYHLSFDQIADLIEEQVEGY